MKFKLMLASFLLTYLISSLARSEGHISYGGDELNRQIYDLAWELSAGLSTFRAPFEPIPGLSVKLPIVIKNLNLIVVDESLIWNNQEVVAINDYFEDRPRIRVSKKRWMETVGMDKERQKRIILHELLPLLNIADADYSYSRVLSAGLLAMSRGFSEDAFINFSLVIPGFLNRWVENRNLYFAEYRVAYSLFRSANPHFYLLNDLQKESVLLIFETYYRQLSSIQCSSVFEISDYYNIKDSHDPFLKKISIYMKSWLSGTCGLNL